MKIVLQVLGFICYAIAAFFLLCACVSGFQDPSVLVMFILFSVAFFLVGLFGRKMARRTVQAPAPAAPPVPVSLAPMPQKTVQSDASAMLDALPHFPVRSDGQKQPLRRVSDLDSVRFFSVNARTNAERLGCFVAIDTETTGLSASRDRVLEISAIRYEDFEPVEIFHTMVNPGQPIPPEATRINGITDSLVSDAPPLFAVLPSLAEFIGKSALLGQNLLFDLKFLYRAGLDIDLSGRRFYDTKAIAKTCLKGPTYRNGDIDYDKDFDVSSFSLDDLCDFFGIDRLDAHRATGDAFDTARLFRELFLYKGGQLQK